MRLSAVVVDDEGSQHVQLPAEAMVGSGDDDHRLALWSSPVISLSRSDDAGLAHARDCILAPSKLIKDGVGVLPEAGDRVHARLEGIGLARGQQRRDGPARRGHLGPAATSDLVPFSSILWLLCTTRSRMASVNVGSLR